MRLEEFSKGLTHELESLPEAEENTTEEIRKMYAATLALVNKLSDFIHYYRFESKEEEILFFKFIKPKFFSKLYYYQMLFEIQSGVPAGLKDQIIAYYLHELEVIKNYIGDNKALLTYYRSGSEIFDPIYFVRKEPDLFLHLQAEGEPGNYSAVYDQKLSRLLAYESIAAFLADELNRLQSGALQQEVTWTAPKAALIELLYAIQSCGVCNNGTLEVKELASHFENLFNIKLGNYYRTFQEIRIRKTRTMFLDQLKDCLVKRMDSTDENPKFISE